MPRQVLNFSGPLSSDNIGTTVFRGVGLETVKQEIRSGYVEGTSVKQYHLQDNGVLNIINEGDNISKIKDHVDLHHTDCTGGFTDDVSETRRYRGSNGILYSIDSSKTSLDKVEYNYDFMNIHEGYLVQIINKVSGEIRDENGDLIGLVKEGPPDARTGARSTKIDFLGKDNLPATSPDSMFADEREWVSPNNRVAISDALNALLLPRRNADKEDVAENFALVEDNLSSYTGPIYSICFEGGEPSTDTYELSDIDFAFGRHGELDPRDIPSHVLGSSI